MPLTEGDLQASIDRVAKAMRESGAGELADLVHRLSKTTPRVTRRAPIGIVHEGAAGPGMFSVLPEYVQLRARPTHLVLEPRTARAYDLLDFKVGARCQTVNWGRIPLEPFSVEYVPKNDALAEILRWRGVDAVSVGCRVELVLERNSAVSLTERVPVRGLLWCDVEDL